MDDVAIKVSSVSKTFKLPHEKQGSVKSLFVNMFRGKRTYEHQQVLKNVSFEVKKGEFFGIVGRNGSGKSTLLKLLAGIYVPTKGDIWVNGKLTPFIELGVGFNYELTGRENVFLNGALLGFNRTEMRAMYDDIVAFAELEKFMDQKLKNYSSGMQVRLAFSIAIRARSDILLIDEVLAVGDAAFQQKCFDYFEELKQQNRTVVFISHDMGAIRRFCTKAIYIDKGKLTASGTATEVADVYTIDNIETAQATASKNDYALPPAYDIATKILDQNKDRAVVQVAYKSKEKDDMYIGISVMRDGVSVAEINTLPGITVTGSGKLTYSLDLTLFNAGIYQIDTALFRLKNRQLLSFSKSKSKFVITDEDPSKGASLKLANTWKRV
jgi:ABC-2 type transport system ATP-binding protein